MQQSYAKLKHLYKTFRATLNPYFDVSALAELGVDVTMVNLHDETARGGFYYLPMSQPCLESLNERPDFDPDFCMDDHQWNQFDACTLFRAFSEQMWDSKGRSLDHAYDKTKWRPKQSVMNIFDFSSTLLT